MKSARAGGHRLRLHDVHVVLQSEDRVTSDLELLGRGSQIDLLAPCARILRMKVPVALRDRRRNEERLGVTIRKHRPHARCVDAAIDHDVGDMNALRAQLASH